MPDAKLNRKYDKLLSILFARSEISVIAASLILFSVFVSTEGFLTGYNLFNISRTASLFIIISLGQAIVIVNGGMNVSLGAIGGLSMVCMGYMIQNLSVHPIVATILAILIGITLGLINGFIITRFKLIPFVATLAMSFVYTGLIYYISKGNAFQGIPSYYTIISRRGAFGVPYLFWVMIGAISIMVYVFNYTVIGRRMLATGGNVDAARLSGINTQRITMLAHGTSGFLAAFAGIMTISWLGNVPPSIGNDWMLTSVAVSVIGGTLLKGGEISPLGILFSGILLALVKNGLILLQVNIYLEQTFLGFIILAAVVLGSVRSKYLKNN